jgi:hypothetical protein
MAIGRWLVVLAFGACGGGGGDGGRYHCGAPPREDGCIEYRMLASSDLDKVRSGCPTSSWASGSCPATGILGGCRVVPIEVWDEVNWYYAGARFTTAADVMAECDAAGGTFLPTYK